MRIVLSPGLAPPSELFPVSSVTVRKDEVTDWQVYSQDLIIGLAIALDVPFNCVRLMYKSALATWGSLEEVNVTYLISAVDDPDADCHCNKCCICDDPCTCSSLLCPWEVWNPCVYCHACCLCPRCTTTTSRRQTCCFRCLKDLPMEKELFLQSAPAKRKRRFHLMMELGL